MVKRKIRLKSFTSLTVLWIFTVLGFSGIVLYLTPSGRIDNLINWSFIEISKQNWQGIHLIFATLFMFFIVLHLFFNWRSLVCYVKVKLTNGMNLKKEFVLSLLVTGFFLVASVTRMQPFSKLSEWRENIKFSEDRADHKDAIFTDNSGKNPEHTDQNHPDSEERNFNSTGSGYGRKTVSQICDEQGISLAEGLRLLGNRGISAKGSDRIRQLADSKGLRPSELAEIISRH